MAKIQAPKGTFDILPGEIEKWQHVEAVFRSTAASWGYQEIRTPIFERTELFSRTSGDSSEIVTKQMYTFEDKGGRSMTLRPELTAPTVRALLEGGDLQGRLPLRLLYAGPVFRYEQPQAGRFRQSHQFGLELIGSPGTEAEAEIIELTANIYRQTGVGEVKVRLNSLGDAESRQRYAGELLNFAADVLKEMPEDVQMRAAKNPLRLLDTKDPKVQERIREAPAIIEFWDETTKTSFDRLCSILQQRGVDFDHDPAIVRGLDYYTGAVFEVHSSKLGAQSALCGGGRYDHLIHELGGPPVPCVGVGMGIERLLMAADLKDTLVAPHLVVLASESWSEELHSLASAIRATGAVCIEDFDSKNLRQALKRADKMNASTMIFLREDGGVLVRDLESGDQEEYGSLSDARANLVSREIKA
ncbi:MAG: histidine--tRNA ligase [Fimbriimonadaceae bacterium]